MVTGLFVALIEVMATEPLYEPAARPVVLTWTEMLPGVVPDAVADNQLLPVLVVAATV
jgi:hypothetical protein